MDFEMKVESSSSSSCTGGVDGDESAAAAAKRPAFLFVVSHINKVYNDSNSFIELKLSKCATAQAGDSSHSLSPPSTPIDDDAENENAENKHAVCFLHDSW